MKRLLIIIALLLVPGLAFGEGFPGRGAPNYSLRCWPINGVVGDQSYSDAQVINTQDEGCWEGSLTVNCPTAGGDLASSASNRLSLSGVATHCFVTNSGYSRTRGIGLFYYITNKAGITCEGWSRTGDSCSGYANQEIGLYVSRDLLLPSGNTGIVVGGGCSAPLYTAIILGGSDSSIPWDGVAPGYINGGHIFRKCSATSNTWIRTWIDTSTSNSTIYPMLTSTGGITAGSDILIPNIDFSDLLQPAHLSTFTADDDTALGDYTPDVGESWTEALGTATIQSNKLQVASVSSNQAYFTTTTSFVGGYIQAKLSTTTMGGSWASIIPRYVDGVNWYQCSFDPINDIITVDEYNASSYTNRASSVLDTAGSTEYLVTCVDTSSKISAYINAVSASYASASSFPTATIKSLRFRNSGAGNTAENVAIWPITNNAYDNAFARVGY